MIEILESIAYALDHGSSEAIRHTAWRIEQDAQRDDEAGE
jgi:hypothetical protein